VGAAGSAGVDAAARRTPDARAGVTVDPVKRTQRRPRTSPAGDASTAHQRGRPQWRRNE
jgi:hypothetical protein